LAGDFDVVIVGGITERGWTVFEPMSNGRRR